MKEEDIEASKLAMDKLSALCQAGEQSKVWWINDV